MMKNILMASAFLLPVFADAQKPKTKNPHQLVASAALVSDSADVLMFKPLNYAVLTHLGDTLFKFSSPGGIVYDKKKNSQTLAAAINELDLEKDADLIATVADMLVESTLILSDQKRRMNAKPGDTIQATTKTLEDISGVKPQELQAVGNRRRSYTAN